MKLLYLLVLAISLCLLSCEQSNKKAICREIGDTTTLILWVPKQANAGDTILPMGLSNLYIVVAQIKYQ